MENKGKMYETLHELSKTKKKLGDGDKPTKKAIEEINAQIALKHKANFKKA